MLTLPLNLYKPVTKREATAGTAIQVNEIGIGTVAAIIVGGNKIVDGGNQVVRSWGGVAGGVETTKDGSASGELTQRIQVEGNTSNVGRRSVDTDIADDGVNTRRSQTCRSQDDRSTEFHTGLSDTASSSVQTRVGRAKTTQVMVLTPPM
jgi:hypothetical protein